MSDFEIIMLNEQNSRKHICKIHYNNFIFAEIATVDEEIIIRFFRHPINYDWQFKIDQAIENIKLAKEKYLAAAQSLP